MSAEGISINDDVWITTGSKILNGVTIGKGYVLGTGSVVTRSFPPYSVVSGVPARIIRSRIPELHKKEPVQQSGNQIS